MPEACLFYSCFADSVIWTTLGAGLVVGEGEACPVPISSEMPNVTGRTLESRLRWRKPLAERLAAPERSWSRFAVERGVEYGFGEASA